jgi:hypothetical protein
MAKCELEIDTRFERARQLKPGRTMAAKIIGGFATAQGRAEVAGG